jgi:hypothetical protein
MNCDFVAEDAHVDAYAQPRDIRPKCAQRCFSSNRLGALGRLAIENVLRLAVLRYSRECYSRLQERRERHQN